MTMETMENIIYYLVVAIIVLMILNFSIIFIRSMFTADATKSFSAYVDKHTTKKKGCFWSFLWRK